MRLLLIDGLNIVRRVYEANPAPESPEKIEGVVRSAMGSFKRALKEHQPTHVLAPFDHGGNTWRHDLYPAYRQNRKPMPEILREALPGLKAKLHQDLGIPTVTVPGVEADDVIAAVYACWAKHYPAKSATVLSTDKDLTALVELGAIVYDHFNGETRDAAWIAKKMGVKPAQVQDFLALMGDSVDGVPGVPGVGPKTAQDWLAAYPTLTDLLHADLPGKKFATLKEQADLAVLSRQLIAFKTDFTLGLTFKDLRLAKPEPEYCF